MWRSSLRSRSQSLRDAIGRAVLLPLAGAYRQRWQQPLFIAITGSCGKTTAKHLAQAVLESRLPGLSSRKGTNRGRALIQTIPFLRRHHRFCLVELGSAGAGTLEELARLFRPDIAAVTCVGYEHVSAFDGLESVAREKATLLRHLTPEGVAILNWDDPHTRAMAAPLTQRVISVGEAADADLRAESPSSSWPDRLSFYLHFQGRLYPVQTRLCGQQWLASSLAALGIGVAAGLPIEAAIEAISRVDPFHRRVEPIRTVSGIDLIRDDWKGSSWTVPLAFEFLAQARAPRKVLLLGQVSDDRTRPRQLYRRLAEEGRGVADKVYLFGQWALHGLRARRSVDDDSILAFPDARQALIHMEKALVPGDLVYSKAAAKDDLLLEESLSRPFWQPARAGNDALVEKHRHGREPTL